MKLIYSILSLALLLSPYFVQAKLNVFACEPEWSSLMQELTGKHADIYTATTAHQDPHRIEARPSLIAKMRRADVVVCSGSDLEAGWLPLLLRASGNPRIQSSQAGYIETSQLVDRLDIPAKSDRSMGDVHAGGNPHVHLDPRRIDTIASAIEERLTIIDPQRAADYQTYTNNFLARWREHIKQWEEKAKPLMRTRAVVHHKDWRYLFDWLGISDVAALEPKPGVAPGAGHLARLKEQMQQEPAHFILYAAYQNDKAARWLQQQTAIKAIELPYTVGGSAAAKDLFSLMDDTINKLLAAIQ